jgi:hypothetical protein
MTASDKEAGTLAAKHEVADKDLRADEYQYRRQRILQVGEPLYHRRQREVGDSQKNFFCLARNCFQPFRIGFEF